MRPQGEHNELKPPNLYYDYGNARQTFHPPLGLQTATGYIPLNSRPPGPQGNDGRMPGPNHDGGEPNTQDVRFMGVPSEYHNHESFNPDLDQTFEGNGVRPNPPPLSVCSPRGGFGLTCLRVICIECG